MHPKVIWFSIFLGAFFLLYIIFKITWQATGLNSLRLPTYAGNWYVGKKSRLIEDLDFCSRAAQPVIDGESAGRLSAAKQELTRPILAIIAPHAAYRYSGRVAAHSYQALKNQKVKRIFLIGPCHQVRFHGAVLPVSRVFRTPLGDSPVDSEVTLKLLQSPLFREDEAIQKFEHSIEMQLPFIQHTFGSIKIVPVLIGNMSDPAELESIARLLKTQLQADDLVVVSSDFTHWGRYYHYQPFKEDIKENITKLDSRAYSYLERLDLKGFRAFKQETADTICGFNPCCILLDMLPKDSRCTLLKYNTSQDVMGTASRQSRQRSISYMAIAFTGSSWTE